jgi:hypothetical protein
MSFGPTAQAPFRQTLLDRRRLVVGQERPHPFERGAQIRLRVGVGEAKVVTAHLPECRSREDRDTGLVEEPPRELVGEVAQECGRRC